VRQRHRLLALLVGLGAITFLDRLAMAALAPRIQDDLGIRPERWGWVAGAFALSYAVFQVPLGTLGDRLGQRKVLTALVLWWSLFTALTGAAPGFTVLVLTQLLFGAGEAGAYPCISGVIARWYPAAERARAQGFVWGASRIGGALCPLLVAPLAGGWGWRGALFALAGVGLMWSASWWWWHRDYPGLKRGITPAELAEIGTPRALPAAVPWSRILRQRQFWLILGMYWCYVWGSWFYFSWLHTYLVRGRGFSLEEMAIYSAAPFVMGLCGNLAGGFLSDHLATRYGLRMGRRLTGSLGLGGAALLLVSAALTPGKAAVVALLSLGYGVMDVFLPSAWAVCLDVAPRHAGAVSGAMNTAGALGGFACAMLFGYLVRWSGSYDAPLIVIAAMLMTGSLLFARIDPTRALVKEEA